MRTLSAVGDQPCDRRADWRNLFDELFDRLELLNSASALGTARQGYFNFCIDLGGHDTMGTRMPLGTTGTLPLAVRDLLGLAPAERRRLPSCGSLSLVELFAQPPIFLFELSYSLFEISEPFEQLRQIYASVPVHEVLHCLRVNP
jgi:hypothetical protein